MTGFLRGFPRSLIEGLTKYMAVISSDHAYIHQGIGKVAIVEAGSISASYKIGFKTPSVASGKYIHWRPAGLFSDANAVKFRLYEDNAYIGGTDNDIETLNRNLDGIVPSYMQDMKKGVAAVLTGTLIQLIRVGSTGNIFTSSGGGAGADDERVLLPDTDYVIEVLPGGATNTDVELFWYEEDGFDPAG